MSGSDGGPSKEDVPPDLEIDSSGQREQRQRFPKAARLTRASEFRRVREQGRSSGGRFLVLGVFSDARSSPTGDTRARIGFITSRRVGGAVERNRVRRRLREIVRAHRPLLRVGVWLVVIARHTAAKASLAELTADWLKLARRAGILVPPLPPPAAPPAL